MEDEKAVIDVVDAVVVAVVVIVVAVVIVEQDTGVGGRCHPKLIGTNETIADNNQMIAMDAAMIFRFIHLSYKSGSFMWKYLSKLIAAKFKMEAVVLLEKKSNMNQSKYIT